MMTDEEQHDLKAQLRAAEERIANLEDRDALLRDAVMWFNFHRPVWKTGDNKFPPWFIEAKTQRRQGGTHHMLASAPDMYEALKGLLQRWMDPGSITSEHWEAARAALSKAEGGT